MGEGHQERPPERIASKKNPGAGYAPGLGWGN
jgi:hypothetical protein